VNARLGVGVYVCWQWWATMYLRHHWRIDLLAGAGYSTIVYFACRKQLLKVERSNEPCAWDRLKQTWIASRLGLHDRKNHPDKLPTLFVTIDWSREWSRWIFQ